MTGWFSARATAVFGINWRQGLPNEDVSHPPTKTSKTEPVQYARESMGTRQNDFKATGKTCPACNLAASPIQLYTA